MKSRMWIPGAAGMLGRSIINLIDKKRYKVFKTTKKELNLFDQKKIEFFIKKNKKII